MPFTPAHPAIILPLLNRKYFSATGLIIGSVSPDFEYFLKASTQGVHGHTLAGLFYFDLPITLVWALIFHLLIKRSLIANLPTFLQRRLQPLQSLDFRNSISSNFMIFGFSALLGAFSHIFWDSFTHNGRFFVELLPIYKGAYVPFHGAKYPLWYALQNISTYFGLAIIAAYIFFLPVDKNVASVKPKILYWITLILLSALLVFIRFIFFPIDFRLGNIVVNSISSLLIAVCLVSLIPYFKVAQPSN